VHNSETEQLALPGSASSASGDAGLLTGYEKKRFHLLLPHFAQGRRWAGAPPRRSRALLALLAMTAGMSLSAGFLAARFVSPAQVAARAAAPAPSLILARVRFGLLPAIEQLRGTVSAGTAVPVGAPSDLAGSLPVVTSVAVAVGQQVTQAQLLVTVAQRPVFVFAGVIPAFRVMAPGMTGPDVAELQAGLAAAGFGTGTDASGVYGPGTAAAVSGLYHARGVTPIM
jgi:hypothetical protein